MNEMIEKEFIDSAEEVIIGSEQGTTFPTKVGSTLCNALRLATGSNLSPLGIVNCTFDLGKITFINDFIVCQNLTRPLILERDFLMQNHITVQYAENGKCILSCQQEELIATLDIASNPQLKSSNSVFLPRRTLAVIQVNSDLKPEQSGKCTRLSLVLCYLKSIQMFIVYL